MLLQRGVVATIGQVRARALRTEADVNREKVSWKEVSVFMEEHGARGFGGYATLKKEYIKSFCH